MFAKQRLKGLLLAAARLLGAGTSRQAGALILCHHRVDDSGRPHTLTFEAFRRQMTYLHDHGARFMTMTEIGAALARDEVPERAVCVTFDDGARSSYEPIHWLAGIGGRCTQFAVVRWADEGSSEWMGWDELRALARLGVEIGSHTRDHRDLRGLGAAELAAQLRGSRERLAAEIGREISSFAYPYGRFDAAAVRAVKAAGYRWAATTQHVHAVPRFGPLLIPRYEVFDQEELAELFEGRAWLFYGALKNYMLVRNRLLAG